jgi:hypothetical protein
MALTGVGFDLNPAIQLNTRKRRLLRGAGVMFLERQRARRRTRGEIAVA